jgi:hypothetical protein
MKKTTLNAIATLFEDLLNEPVNCVYNHDEVSAILAEVNAELNKGANEKAQRNAEYESVKDVLLAPLAEGKLTIAELYEAVKDELPAGFTRAKVQYAITKLFADEVEKFEGKPNTYGLKA